MMMHPAPAEPSEQLLPPAVLPLPPGDDENEGAEQEPVAGNTVTAIFVSLEGASVDLTFHRCAALRNMQMQLCSAFGKGFAQNAALLCVGEKAFRDFGDVPLRTILEYGTVQVIFEKQTTDPYFFDYLDRRRASNITLEEECLWEHSVSVGETELSLDEWVFSRRFGK